ncbi:MAG: DUF4259 domain-containing protein [Dermatophilaceae bacterium]|nr:DUF4259 domain-containing protein [Intrasporangiaceae bacterium]
MSAWGVGPFESDEALDFLGDIEESGRPVRLGKLARPLEHVAHSGDYLEGPDVSEAVAAAAFIGAVLNPTAAVDEPDRPEWTAQVSADQIDTELVELARQALRRALRPHENELHELWVEAGAVDDWQASLRRALTWLGDRDD